MTIYDVIKQHYLAKMSEINAFVLQVKSGNVIILQTKEFENDLN